MMNVIKWSIALVAIAMVCNVLRTDAQQVVVGAAKEDARPDNYDLMAIARFPEVAAEIGLTARQEAIAERLEQEFRYIEAQRRFPAATKNAQGQEQPKPDLDELNAKSRQLMQDSFTDNQLARLRQLYFQRRVATRGYGNEFKDGDLGLAVGINDEQKEGLQKKAAAWEAEAAASIERILAELQKKVLNELTPEQKVKAEQTLGEPVYSVKLWTRTWQRFPPVSGH